MFTNTLCCPPCQADPYRSCGLNILKASCGLSLLPAFFPLPLPLPWTSNSPSLPHSTPFHAPLLCPALLFPSSLPPPTSVALFLSRSSSFARPALQPAVSPLLFMKNFTSPQIFFPPREPRRAGIYRRQAARCSLRSGVCLLYTCVVGGAECVGEVAAALWW